MCRGIGGMPQHRSIRGSKQQEGWLETHVLLGLLLGSLAGVTGRRESPQRKRNTDEDRTDLASSIGISCHLPA